MERIVSSTYAEKQKAFVSLIEDVQRSLVSKEYKKQGYSLNEYTKMRWNISQAQAYRYLICGKVLNQLEEFEIKPSYERLCKSLYKVAKTPIQMKLLWSTILKKTDNKPEYINSNYISKVWNELCKNEKYYHICHFEDDIMTKVEKSLNHHSSDKKHKQLKSIKSRSQINNLPSPTLSESLSESLSDSSSEFSSIANNNINNSLSPISNYTLISNETTPINNYITIPSIPSIPYIGNEYYLPLLNANELYYEIQQPILYIQEQQQILYN
ncbi:hypothetical protein LY90DRAFT_667834 [Neocallimastix californiae]|jgi:hypothetical protein|uniref:Uncharacterized protein n=1 Tax=Neocallimastix californiae TaxID=1754190 RepID=A0A1Y2E6J2_9FUNG|nr:hypothetical protein LY90DRAFT_667834 [Neocallimastix californiae]|eukprot:ORY66906.1 hypothetical protein LY90DRAFT_667834 [Neocallimastix californiae]